MSLWDIEKGLWNEPLLKLAAGKDGVYDLRRKLGDVREDGGGSLGSISSWFVSRYGFPEDCQIAPFTGDNPSTILSLPLRPLDAIVSLGTSTTFLMSTPKYIPHPSYHFFNHPTTPGLYMFMLCYKNGGLARESIRDSINEDTGNEEKGSWDEFNRAVMSSLQFGMRRSSDPIKIGLYFPLPEIVPNVRAGTWRFYYNLSTGSLNEVKERSGYWKIPRDDARIIVESQLLSLRLRSQNLVLSPSSDLPPQPRRIYLVGGGSLDPAIVSLVGDVLGGAEGVYSLNIGGNACALGAAYKAAWSRERRAEEGFEEFIGARWKEEDAVRKVGEGYRSLTWGEYGKGLKGFEEAERRVLDEGK
jgi:xylulokinase